MLSVKNKLFMLSVVMLSVVRLSVVRLSVIGLRVVRLSDVAPRRFDTFAVKGTNYIKNTTPTY